MKKTEKLKNKRKIGEKKEKLKKKSKIEEVEEKLVKKNTNGPNLNNNRFS